MSEYSVNTPLSPNALPIPPVRRGVSMDPAFDVFEGNQGFDQELTLAQNQSDAPVYSFESGAGADAANPAEDLTFDYMPASNNTGMEEQNEALSPQQAQQEMRKLQQQLREQQEANMTAPSSSHVPDDSKESPSSMEDASSPSDDSLNPNGLAFPSMNRGSSNIQAALEELQTAEYAATHAQHQQNHMPTPSPRGELSHSQQSWHEYSHSEHEGGYHSDAYTSATDTEEHEMLDPPERRQEYDGSYQVHVTSAQPHSTIPGHHNHMYGNQPHPSASASGSHHSVHHNLPHTHGHQTLHTSPPHQLHHHGHHGHHGHHHGHHHHSHSHSHSVPPTVPSVAEQEREDIDAPPQEMPAEDKQLLDSSFLSGLRNSPLPPTLSYSRSNSASSASSAGVRSGGSSPQPNQRQVFQPGQVALLQQAGIILSPQPQSSSLPQRRHSGHATLQVSHLLNPNAASALNHSRPHSPSNSSYSMPPIFRPGLDRSPSVDGISRQQRPVSASPQLPTGPEGKGLYLHPSPIQEQMQQAYYSSHSHHVSSHHSHSHTQSASASPPAVSINPTAGVGGHKLVPPASAPSLGRSFSHDSLSTAHIQVKQEVYYSDGGSGYSSAQPSPRGSMTFPHGIPGVGSPAPNSASSYTSPPPHNTAAPPHFVPSSSGYTSTTSSGAATPLRGPAPVRGSNSLNDLHHLLLLHQQSTSSANRSLLPTCPTGAASSPAAVGHPASSERIGAYTREERAKRVARYQDKRTRRNWQKRVLYQVRKDFAVSRKRVGGRFIKKENSSCDCPDLCLPTCPHYKPKDIKVEDHSVSSRKK